MRSSLSFLAFLPLLVAFPTPAPSPLPLKSTISNLRKRTTATGTTAEDYLNYATSGINELQSIYYNSTAGLWGAYTDGVFAEDWWNSANVLTMLADLQDYSPTPIAALTATIFDQVYENAQRIYPGYLDGFYDDELWWALAWIKVYDVTNNEKYLSLAESIWEDAHSVWGQTPCGGLWWDKAHTGVAAIANGLYLSTAAKLANRSPSSPSSGYYFNAAMESYTWFVGSGMINSDHTINDGLDLSTCRNNNATVFSYNQGAPLQGLAELTWATGNSSYNTLANTIAAAAISALSDSSGIFHDSCETSGCDGDEQQFKGVFARAIEFLYVRAVGNDDTTRARYLNFLQVNADAIWAHDKGPQNQLGLVWSGGNDVESVQTQGSALDVLVGAAVASL